MTGLSASADLAMARATTTALVSPDHGPRHWRDVARIGFAIAAEEPGVDMELVFLFAALHDTQRQSEFHDPAHGLRAAQIALSLPMGLSVHREGTLVMALEHHDEGTVAHDDPTIAACWDADRLTLPRVGIAPQKEYFSTRVVQQEFFDWTERALTIMGSDDMDWKEIAREYDDAID